MALSDWLVRRLGGSEPVGDPREPVELAIVRLEQSELLVTALRESGVPAATHEAHDPVSDGFLRQRARVYVRREDLERATEVLAAFDRTWNG